MSAGLPPLRHVLVANRGEIAVRVLRGARAAGYATTAVYSEADRDAPHVRMADQAVCLGPAPVRQSYLDGARVIAAARTTGADAIHPGYGMLAENAAFARACAEAGLTFIGPSPDAIALMGDKAAARRAAQAAGVPCIPGYDGEVQAPEQLLAEARRIGFPLMVKAAAGGGGRGMRRVAAEAELAVALRDAASEAEAAFGDGRLLLELAVEGARHVEIQVIADRHGQVLHLGERDCSVQRRFQKVLEEAPSPAVDADLRARMGTAAVGLARACDYVGAGTVEFLLAPDGRFFFLEMNTRLQVEHPVTELVTGLDLVQLQLRVAAGERLALQQADVAFHGHAIEARLCTEDPGRGFLPQTGRVVRFGLPPAELARVDHGLCEGQSISPHYDSMVAKVIAHGETRAEALRKLDRALSQLSLFGVENNRAFLRRVLCDPTFASGRATTALLGEAGEALTAAAAPDDFDWALAALLHCERGRDGTGPARPLCVTEHLTHMLDLRCGEATRSLALSYRRRPAQVLVLWDDRAMVFDGWRFVDARAQDSLQAQRICVQWEGRSVSAAFAFEGDRVFLQCEREDHVFVDETHRPASALAAAGTGRITSSLEGAVLAVSVGEGDRVSRGQSLLVLEAMKLQHHVLSDVDGVVRAVHVAAGAQVGIGGLLIEIEPAPPDADAVTTGVSA